MRRFLRSRRAALLMVAALAGVGTATAQGVPERDLKAAFVFNFIQFTQWPASGVDGGTLNLCASPGSPLYEALAPLAGKVANGRPIALHSLIDVRPELCHVVVAIEADRGRIGGVLETVSGRPVLTVTDDPEIARAGVMIGMAVNGGHMSFIVDNSRAARAGLSISSRLLRLARSVQ